MGKKFVSIEMGSKNIKVVSGTKSKKSFKIENASMVQVGEDIYGDGEIRDMEEVSKLVAQAVMMGSVNSKYAAISMNSTKVIIREVTIPQAKPSEVRELINYEISQQLPIDFSEYVVEYKHMEDITDNEVKKTRFLVAAMPKNMAESFLQLLRNIDIKPHSLDLNSSDLSNILEKGVTINGDYDMTGKSIAVIDLGFTSISVNTVIDGVLKFNRTIEEGGSLIEGIIMDKLAVDRVEAERMKNDMDFFDESDTSNSEPKSSIRALIDNWIIRIQRVLQFYTSRSDVKSISDIFVYGGLTNMKGLSGYMERSLGIPVRPMVSLSNVSYVNGLSDLDIKYYVNAIGALGRLDE